MVKYVNFRTYLYKLVEIDIFLMFYLLNFKRKKIYLKNLMKIDLFFWAQFNFWTKNGLLA